MKHLQKLIGMAAIGLAICSVSGFARNKQTKPAENKVNVGAMVTEIMKMHMGEDADNTMSFAMWLPKEFFVESAISSGQTREQAEAGLSIFEGYTLLVAGQQRGDTFGDKETTTKEIVGRSVLVTEDGTELKPVDAPPRELVRIANLMKMSMKTQGPFAEAMQVMVFPDSVDGKPVVDMNNRDKLTLKVSEGNGWSGFDATWRTPFDALTPSTPCVKCSEPVSAKFSYCPYCGTKSEK